MDALDDDSIVLLLVLPYDIRQRVFQDAVMQWFAAQSDNPKSVVTLASSCRGTCYNVNQCAGAHMSAGVEAQTPSLHPLHATSTCS